MDLICPFFTLTYFAGTYPAESGGVVLLGTDHYLEEGSSLSGAVSQLVQRADFVRAGAPQFFPRGNGSLDLQWEEVRKISDPGAALATAIASAESLPSGPGWVRLDIPSQARRWAITPVVVESRGWNHSPRTGLLRLTWGLRSGLAAAIATEAPASAITTETGFAFATEAGDYFALESHS